MVGVTSPAKGMLGHHMEGSWRLQVTALEEPENKGEKHKLKQQSAGMCTCPICFGHLTLPPDMDLFCLTAFILELLNKSLARKS